MDADSFKTEIEEKLKFSPALGASYKLDLDDGEIEVFLDGTQSPPVISKDSSILSGDPDTTLRCTLETFKGILNGTQDPNMAYMMGKLKIEGSMGYALKLASVLED